MHIRKGTVALPYLEQWRVYKLMTREMLANASGISVATILKIENKVTAGARFLTIVKLAEALDISTDDLRYHLPPHTHIDSAPQYSQSPHEGEES